MLILLTRRPALAFFGRPAAPALGVGGAVLGILIFCFAYAGVARLVSAAGLPAMSMASDDWNPVSGLGNAIGEDTGITWLQSSTYLELKALSKSIQSSTSLEQLGDQISSPLHAARVAVNENQPQVFLLWLVHLIAVPTLLRRR